MLQQSAASLTPRDKGVPAKSSANRQVLTSRQGEQTGGNRSATSVAMGESVGETGDDVSTRGIHSEKCHRLFIELTRQRDDIKKRQHDRPVEITVAVEEERTMVRKCWQRAEPRGPTEIVWHPLCVSVACMSTSNVRNTGKKTRKEAVAAI